MLITAVIVTYFPNLERLRSLIRCLLADRVRIIVVDNGSQLETVLHLAGEPLRTQPIEWVFNPDNRGIGAAQNQGIQLALEAQADFVAVFDQDSLPAPGMLKTLVSTLETLSYQGCRVAAVGPLLIDEGSGRQIPFISYRNGLKRRVFSRDNAEPVECFSLLASGTVFRADAFQIIGLMDEGLFLEYVDVEWGARAKSKGFRLYGVPAARLLHNLGDDRVPISSKFSVPLHSPVRHYYSFRNAVALQRRPYIPLHWKLADIIRCLVLFFLLAALNKPRFEQVRMMLLGVRHGLMGVSGPYSAGCR